MSKYIKLEDAIEQVKTEFYGGGYQEWLEISIDNLINRIANLPTIEVSEDTAIRIVENECFRDDLSQEIKDYLFSDLRHKLYHEQVEVSEDCVSRKAIQKEIGKLAEKRRGMGLKNMAHGLRIAYRIIENAPSVVPSRAEGEWLLKEKENWLGKVVEVFECSVCGTDHFMHRYISDSFVDDLNFCPNCGAKMRGVKK